MAAPKSKFRLFVEQIAPPFHLKHWTEIRLVIYLLTDALVVATAFWSAFWLRLETFWPTALLPTIKLALPIFVVSNLAVFVAGGMYRQVWRYANFNSALVILRCVLAGVLLSAALCAFLLNPLSLPRSIYFLFALVEFLLLCAVKFSWRFWTAFQASLSDPKHKPRCLVYGAGKAGSLLIRHAVSNPNFPYKVVGFIDDDRGKRKRVLHGLKILGVGQELTDITKRYRIEMVILAMHSASGKVIQRIVSQCHEAGIKPLIMPDMATSLGESIFQPRSVDVQDLMRRAPKNMDAQVVKHFFSGTTVLVTGAGGSIGSEICRQVIRYAPKCLVLVDSSEYNLYKIELELSEVSDKKIELVAILGSTTDAARMNRLFENYLPDYVLHAAAYKHVPLLETNPTTAILNNVEGTRVVALASLRFGAKRFLLISTDKAVRPLSTMGKSKRWCEMLIQSLSAIHPGKTGFCAVRFGNVLGSSGSVVPRFIRQIREGGPVTITHPDMARYFMLTSEAVGLVLQSIARSRGGEIFVLNMGKQVKILDLAKQLIKLSGKEPGKDIDIIFTGTRPGEKLHEELIIESTEQTVLTEDIFIARTTQLNTDEILSDIEHLIEAAKNQNTAAMRTLLDKAAVTPEHFKTFPPKQPLSTALTGSPTAIH